MASHKISPPIAKNRSQAGFTLIEILVVVLLLTTISGLGLVVGMDSYRRYAFRADRDTLVSMLEHARSQSVNNICIGVSCANGKPHGVFIDTANSQYVLFQGATYAIRDSAADVITAASPLVGHSGLTEVVFAQLSGNGNPTGDIVLSGATGAVSTISINAVGQIAWTQ